MFLRNAQKLALGFFLIAASAAIPGTASAVDPVTIPRSEVHALTSQETGAEYRVQIWRPAAEPPGAGYPVVYLLDGNAWFGMTTALIDTRSRNRDSTGIAPAVVVGLAYPTDAPYDMKRRTWDLTPAAETVTLPPRPNGKPWPPTGGADAFLRFIENQVKPLVAERIAVDKTQEILLGHSFGGLFALHTMLTQPGAFDTYLAGSPSIWFNDRQTLREAETYLASDTIEKARLYLCVGGEEEDITDVEENNPQAEARRLWKKNNRMIGNAGDFVALMANRPELTVDYTVFDGEDHGTVVPQLLIHGLSFALNR